MTKAYHILIHAIIIVLITNLSFSQSFYFKSGFEASTVLRQNELNGIYHPNFADIYGTDHVTGYNWETNLDDHTDIGNFRIYYEVGNILDAEASIANDPLNNTNQALKFQLIAPNVSNSGSPKGRIQTAINGNTDLKEFSFKVRFYIHPDINVLKNHNDKITWFTIMEFWNNIPSNNEAYPFRVTLNIQKPDTAIGSGLFFGAHGQIRQTVAGETKWNNIWDEVATNYPLPMGQWVTFETYFHEGDSTNGRYKLTVTDSSQNTQVLFDITNYTHHPNDPQPDGISEFNPMKLYTSGTLINQMAQNNKELSVYWDNFELWKGTNLNIDNHEKEYAVLYPNPFDKTISLKTEKNIKSAIIHTLDGQLIEDFHAVNGKTIDISRLVTGHYILSIVLGNDVKKTFKIIKK